MKKFRGYDGLILMLISVLGLIFVQTQDVTGMVFPVWSTWVGLGGLFLGFVLTVTAATGWTRIDKSTDHSAPLRIRKDKK
jgi:FtsH-binding integral membrane protein